MIENKKFTCYPESWSQLPWGEHCRQVIEQQFSPYLKKTFGQYLLKIGALSASINCTDSAIYHHIVMAEQGNNCSLLGSNYQIPLLEKSIDACILAHTLPYSEFPYLLFREIDRVLTDDGWLFLSVNNPISLMGVKKLLPWQCSDSAYLGRFYSHYRLLDWLGLLNYDVLYDRHCHVMPWMLHGGGNYINRYLNCLGCFTVIIARKRTIPLRLTPSKWRQICLQWPNTKGAEVASRFLTKKNKCK